MDEAVATFTSITAARPDQARRYLHLADGNVEAAIELFFSSPDLGSTSAPAPAPAPAAPPRPARGPYTIDSDDDHHHNDDGGDDGHTDGHMDDGGGDDDDDDVQETGRRRARRPGVESDEEMARRLQHEMYGGGGGGGGARPGSDDDGGVRAPMARTTEMLVGPASSGPAWHDDVARTAAAAAAAATAPHVLHRHGGPRAAPGIFNQRGAASIWSQYDENDPAASRAALSRATGGASDASAKSSLLADLFRPPVDLITPLALADARRHGTDQEKWILVNVQDPSIFDCQVLNRDMWKNAQVRETVREHFLFLQYNKGDPRGNDYLNYYFAHQKDNDAAYPHIAIVDPRTGEQVKTWSGSPPPRAAEFLMELHEFLDRYSLKMEKKNPVQKQRKESKKDVAAMSEEEMLEMALHNSLAHGAAGPATEEDPDALTKSVEHMPAKGKAPVTRDGHGDGDGDGDGDAPAPSTPFSTISSRRPHAEPVSTGPDTTRIQFRHSGGRVIRRFELTDPVRRIYEWLKACPLDGTAGRPFELVAMGTNLIAQLDTPIAEAGLKNGTVMVEFVEE